MHEFPNFYSPTPTSRILYLHLTLLVTTRFLPDALYALHALHAFHALFPSNLATSTKTLYSPSLAAAP